MCAPCPRAATSEPTYEEFLAWKASQSASPAPKKEATPAKKELSAAERLRGGNPAQTFTSLLKVVEPETCDLTFYVQLIPKDERQEQQSVRVRCATLGFAVRALTRRPVAPLAQVVLHECAAENLKGVDFLRGLWGNADAAGELLEMLTAIGAKGKRKREARMEQERAKKLTKEAEEAARRAKELAMDSQQLDDDFGGDADADGEEEEEEEEEEAPAPPPKKKKKALLGKLGRSFSQ